MTGCGHVDVLYGHRVPLHCVPMRWRTRHWIASRVIALRRERRWTQKEAAAAAGMSLRQYQRVEHATRNTSADMLDKVLAAFGLDIEQFRKLDLPIHERRRVRSRRAA